MLKNNKRQFIQWKYFDWLRMTDWEYGFTFTFKEDLHLRTAMRLTKHYFSNIDRKWFGQTLKNNRENNDFYRMVFLEKAPARRTHRNGVIKKDWVENQSLSITAWTDETDSSKYLRPKLEREMIRIRSRWTTKQFWHLHGVMILPKNLAYKQENKREGYRTKKNMLEFLRRDWINLIDISKHPNDPSRIVGGSIRIKELSTDDQRGRCCNYICQATKGDWRLQGIEDIYGVGDLLFIEVSNTK